MKKFSMLAAGILLPLCGFSDYAQMRADFENPPPDAKAETWWHFTTNAVTKEGITADLEAMKEIGYGGAHAFFLARKAFPNLPKLEIMDDNWRDLMRHAGKEATRLGLRLGTHNCPGWSSSGGPWISPEDSMKKVVASRGFVKGPFKGKLKLSQPETVAGYYRDIAVIAFPTGEQMPKPKLSATFAEPEGIFSGKPCVLKLKEKNAVESLSFEFEKPFTASVAELRFADTGLYADIEVFASDDGKKFKKVGAYDISYYKGGVTPKYIVLGGGKVSAKYFRFDFRTAKKFEDWESPCNQNLLSVELLSTSMVDDFAEKVSLEQKFSYRPQSGKVLEGAKISQMLNLTGALKPDGSLAANLPAGNWVVLRIGETSTGAENHPAALKGLECDKLSRRGLDAHWPHYMAKLKDDFGAALAYATIDSYEVGGQNWTDDFATQFRKRRGYDIRPWLPAMVGFTVEDSAKTARFFYDLQRTVSDLMAENYYDYFNELCHKNGLMSVVEPYGGMFDSLRCVRNIDIPAGEFWVGRHAPARMTASSSHLFGKKMAATESFTTTAKFGRWQQTPFILKSYGDRAWACGISKIIVHTYAHQPFIFDGPGLTLGENGTNLTRMTTWWKLGGAWVKYLNRTQAVLQSGANAADILMLSGESQPNMMWYVVNPQFSAAGYDYDYCSSDDISDSLKVGAGKIFAAKNGTKYSVLFLGRDKYLSLKTLKAVERLLQAGAVVIGERPVSSPSLSDSDAEYSAFVKKLWGDKKEPSRVVGKGRLFETSDVLAVLKTAGVAPKFRAPAPVSVVMRELPDADAFFVANVGDESVSADIFLRAGANRVPEYWNADAGTVEPVAQWQRESDGTVSIPVNLTARESRIVVFKNGKTDGVAQFSASNGANARLAAFGENRLCVEFLADGSASGKFSNGAPFSVSASGIPAPAEISGKWNVAFQKNRSAPESAVFDKLSSWTESADAGIKYYSGIAVYSKNFDIPDAFFKRGAKILLSLGDVRDVARVRVNGEIAATLWKPPFECDITAFAKRGSNEIEIEVANRWVNRLIGDDFAKSPRENLPKYIMEKRPNDTDRFAFSTMPNAWKKTDNLLPSGLLGPVQIKAVDIAEICATK